uniref:Uncharacterized protein n=1 Tax=Romanomermis culicivorax TaxID=13658 RepID=A0A915J8C8_ROMCU
SLTQPKSYFVSAVSVNEPPAPFLERLGINPCHKHYRQRLIAAALDLPKNLGIRIITTAASSLSAAANNDSSRAANGADAGSTSASNANFLQNTSIDEYGYNDSGADFMFEDDSIHEFDDIGHIEDRTLKSFQSGAGAVPPQVGADYGVDIPSEDSMNWYWINYQP